MSWNSFVPDLLATFVGAMLGILGALSIERRRQKSERQAEAVRYRARAVAVADSIDRNADNVLTQWAALDEQRAVYTDTLEIAVWLAHREEMARLAEDMDVITDTARWFASVESLAGLHSQHRRWLLGLDGTPSGEGVQDGLLHHLTSGSAQLAEAARGLSDRLRAATARESPR